MSTHDGISDDELLLYHYRDGLDAAERVRIATALIAQPELALRLQRLVAQLDAAAALPEVPVPLQTQQRWRAALDGSNVNATAHAPRLLQWHWPAVAALVVAAVAIAFRLGMQLAADRPAPLVAANQPARCECGLKWHLSSVERQLTELPATSGAQRAALIDAVIAQNRIYAIAAESGGDQRLAGALRSFTPLLERIANSKASDDAAAGELAQLNFELQVIQARLTAEVGTSAAPGVAL